MRPEEGLREEESLMKAVEKSKDYLSIFGILSLIITIFWVGFAWFFW